MLDPRLILMVINADHDRQIAAAARARLAHERGADRPSRHSRLSLAVGTSLVRLGEWLQGPESPEAAEHGEAA